MTELQLEFIKHFGRKELSFGCWINYKVDDDYDGDGHYARVVEDIKNGGIFFTPATIYGGVDNSDDKTDYEILGHPVQWNDVFAKLKEMGYESFLGSESLLIDPDNKKGEKKNIEVDKYISPMEQPELIEQLLLLIK